MQKTAHKHSTDKLQNNIKCEEKKLLCNDFSSFVDRISWLALHSCEF